jgi:UDP-N-acetylmuramoylalanine--D-glutamate ligase
LGRHDSWDGVRAVVAGFGVSGFAAADNLTHLGAAVTALDESAEGHQKTEKAELLEVLGATVRLGPGSTATLPDDVDVVVTSPGWTPSAPLLAQARDRGIPVWGEVELAWRMRAQNGAAPWLTVTGTNGKTTTVNMLASILRAAGLRATSAGNVGTPILEAVLHPQPFDVIAVELSSFQLHWQRSVSPVASACLNVAPDHLDWHGSFDEYLRAKGRVYQHTHIACVYNVADPLTEQLVMEAEVVEGCRAIGFTTGMPSISMLGTVENLLVDRAYIEQRRDSAAELASLADLGETAPRHMVANALAAAALVRAYGVEPAAVRDGLRSYLPGDHRIQLVAKAGGVRWINDSKATNPHAANASLQAFPSVVWIAGGLSKGVAYDELVSRNAKQLKAVVLIGTDNASLLEALERHAPDVPVIEAAAGDTEKVQAAADGPLSPLDGDRIMALAVAAAARIAGPGDAVLMAPAAASMDQFSSYAHRGEAFVEAVRRLVEGQEQTAKEM